MMYHLKPNPLSSSNYSLPMHFKRCVRYTRLEVKDANDNSDRLGVGAYGVVYKAYDTREKRYVAQKKIKLEGAEEGIPATALREISNLKMLVHPNVVRLLDAVKEPEKLYLIFELMDSDLKKCLDACPERFSPELVRSYTSQILHGLSFCHCMGVMHRDLKPQNLLVSKDGTIKLADFGLSRAFTPPTRPLTVEVITRWYRSPDLLLGSNTYSPAVDMWSVGCIVAEMSNKKPLFSGDSEIDQIHRIFRYLGTPTEQTWKNCSDFPYWRNNFPMWSPYEWAQITPHLPESGRLLLEVLIFFRCWLIRLTNSVLYYNITCREFLCTIQMQE